MPSPATSLPRLRETPEDFNVDEAPLYLPSGEGGHTFVRIEKRLRTTEEVARDLARAAPRHDGIECVGVRFEPEPPRKS